MNKIERIVEAILVVGAVMLLNAIPIMIIELLVSPHRDPVIGFTFLVVGLIIILVTVSGIGVALLFRD